MASARHGGSRGLRSTSSCAAGGRRRVDERLRVGRHARPRLSDRRDADQLHRRQARERHRPARARLEQPRGDQRVPRARLEVRDPRRRDRHGQGRGPGGDPRALVQRAGVVHGGAGTRGRARSHVLAVRALSGWQGSGDGSGNVPGPRPPGDRDLARDLGSDPVALRVRVGRVPHGGRAVPRVGRARGPCTTLHSVGERGLGAADHLFASGEHSTPDRRDRAPLPHPKGGRRVTRVAVIGGGAWGTALADLLARKGGVEAVTLWAREPEVVESVNREHLNHMFLPGAALAPGVTAEANLVAAVRGADVVVSAAPSHAVRDVMTRARGQVGRGALIVSVSKGLEPERLSTPSCVLADVLPKDTPIAVLSGPSFAREVYARQPTAVVAAAREHAVAQRAQQVFSTGFFRVYSATDMLGVELAGALKNVVALAAGILEGLGMGHNTRAALITRGLAEITRLGVALGAEPATFAGLAGMGDLILTATGPLSRNHQLGVELGEGKRLEDALAGRAAVVEGVNTARSAVTLAERHGVELPIAREVADVLFNRKSPSQAVADLMERELKPEHWR